MKSSRFFLSMFWFCLIFMQGAAAWGQALPLPAAPSLSATAYILQDFATGQVLVEAEADKRVEPASITKLMTAYVVFNELKRGSIRLEDEVLISEKAWRTGGSRTFVEVNTRVPVETLLQGMIIQSGNDATIALAEHVAGTEEIFVSLMNQQAQILGLTSSNFVNSTGLPHEQHYMTARDIAALARALIRDFPEYYGWYSATEFTYNNITQSNRNVLLKRDPSVDGGKTGHTEAAGYCLVASAQREGMRLISVVMGTRSSDSRARESLTLLNYGFRFYDTRNLFSAGKALARARVWQGQGKELELGLAEDLPITVQRGRWQELSSTIEVQDPITAPISPGQNLGSVTVTLGDEPLVTRPLVALTEIPEGHWWQRLVDWVLLFFA
jgi:serine-type D-Ala-D-Ala carboxypeptidase (penicillin-binding protein 5/6)